MILFTKNKLIILAFFAFANLALGQKILTETIPGTLVSFDLSLIPGGQFGMGSPENDPGAKPNEMPQRTVQLDSFWMGVTEVRYDEFILFYHRENDNDSTRLADRPFSADAVARPTPQYIDYTYGMGKNGFPVVSMTQQAALRYCKWLYEKTGHFYRLPTEAEWEYACKSAPNPAADLEETAWFYDNSFEKYHEVKGKKPNGYGLYDMLGNVAEWTLDFYEEDYLKNMGDTVAVNPWLPPVRRHSRTVKGGSYDSNAADCRCTARQKSEARWQARDPQIPKSRWWNPDSPFVGFRLVRPLKLMTQEDIESFFEKALRD